MKRVLTVLTFFLCALSAHGADRTILLGGVTEVAATKVAAPPKPILLCIEAEKTASITRPLLKINTGNRFRYSGNSYLLIPRTAWKKEGMATYKLNVTTSGNYCVWARTTWTDQWGNSIILIINGEERLLGNDGTYGLLHWVEAREFVHLSAGPNTIEIKNSEPGVKVDQILFCNDFDYCPARNKPVTHNGATGKSTSPSKRR